MLFILLRFVLGFFFFLLCDIVGVYRVAIDNESVIEELGHKIRCHAKNLNEICVPLKSTRSIFRKPCCQRGEHAIERRDLEHGDRNIVCRLECKLAVESEIPKNGENKRNEIRYLRLQMKHFIEKRVRRKLNYSRRSREQSKFDSLKNVFLCAELLIFGSALRFFFLV